MKWVKVAIGAVIAIAVVPMIALSVINLTQEKVREEVVTFEVLTLDGGTGKGTVTSGTYNKILLYSEVDNGDIVINTVSILINDIETLSEDFYLRLLNEPIDIALYNIDDGDGDYIEINDQLSTSLGLLTLNDVVSITFEVTQAPILSGITATLLLLAPVIFVSGVLYFIYNNKQEGI